MAFSIKPLVIWALSFLSFGTLMRRNDRFHFLLNNPVKEILGSITAISKQMFKFKSICQGNSLPNVGCLSSRQPQAQRIAQPIDSDMNLSAEPTTATSQRLRCLTATFFGRQRHMDGPGRWCCLSSHSPYPVHRQSGRASAPICPGHTSGQNACRRCSTCRIRLVTAAIENRFGSSRGHPQQNDGTLLHYRCKHSGRFSRIPESSSIVYLRVSQMT